MNTYGEILVLDKMTSFASYKTADHADGLGQLEKQSNIQTQLADAERLTRSGLGEVNVSLSRTSTVARSTVTAVDTHGQWIRIGKTLKQPADAIKY